ncbi:MAG: hypothetical protein H0W06_09000, partial [Chloroflexia bacterium]|nr:hypothetical protein [Chloroflexia bacterium]
DDDNDGIPDADDPFPFGGAPPTETAPEREPPANGSGGSPLGPPGDVREPATTNDEVVVGVQSAPLVTALPATGEGQQSRVAGAVPVTLALLGLALAGAATGVWRRRV